MLQGLAGLVRSIERLTVAVGRAASWCALAIVLLGFAVVLLRYVFGFGSIWLQETIIYAHAALFLLAAARTLKEGGHVRVDVFYATASPRAKALVDLCGALFLLLPFAIVLPWFSLPYVMRSWAILRGVAPPEITTRHIYVGIIPFVVIQLAALFVLWFVPGLATWLPRMLYGG
jgi:TRAP-type mannitol/chloroaromatic compound transport system permease small subunit